MRAGPLVTIVLAGATLGCAAGEVGPRETLRETARALRGEPRLTVADGVETPSSRTDDERRALAERLEAAPLERRALVTLATDEGAHREVALVEEGGRMCVEAGVLGVPLLDTPERAIAALHRAIARELMLGPGSLLAEEERRVWLEERARYRDGTASPDALDVRVDGDEARALTPLGDEILLVREGVEWRVASVRAAGLE